MKNLRITDLHCDTLTKAYDSGKSLISNDLHLSVDRLREYDSFCQVFAIWSDDGIGGGEAWTRFLDIAEFLDKQLYGETDLFRISGRSEVRGNREILLAVEGGKLIEHDLTRLDTMLCFGVGFLTLTWNDPCPICGACGTEEGVSDFGYEVLKKCRGLGIIPDISHASDRTAYDVIDFCGQNGGICVATHSNSRAICDHVRNLTDDIFKRLVRLGSLVGISMAPQHLNTSGKADISDIVRHIEHYLSLGGENTVCLGCDFDGIETTPDGIASVSDMYKLANELARRGHSRELIDKIFYKNAHDFIEKNFLK